MLYINKITKDASQQLTLTGIPGVQITMTIEYLPRIQGWIMGITSGSFSVQGVSIVGGLNLLRQWKNIIPFGISCVCADGLDPYLVTDFADQRANLYLLNSIDVSEIEAQWFT